MTKRIQTFSKIFLELPWVIKILEWAKVYSPPGFSGVSLHNVISFVVKETQKDNLTTRANSVSFSLFLSIFPAIIFLFTLLPLFTFVQDYTIMLSNQLEGVIPKSAHDYIFTIITDITAIKRDGLLSLGAFLALFFSSNGMLTLMSGFDKAYHQTFKKRYWLKTWLIALALTLVLSFLLIISLFLMVVEDLLLNYMREVLHISETLLISFSIFNWVFAIFMVYTGISLIYTFGPSMHRRTRFINIGSIIATILSLLTSLGFSYFINNFGRYNEIYGSIGALMVMMIWIQFNSFILLVGFELNVSVAVHKSLRYQKKQNAIV
ncbi:MAG: YihY/virulence factor BrkB family protein [Saprospiraceae bacterium]|nr:YihY/virulence factor BrkB family protein [Saprospiraceae bacterium]